MAYVAVAHDEHNGLSIEDEMPRRSSLAHPSRMSFQPLPQTDCDNSPSPDLFLDAQHERGSVSERGGVLRDTMHSFLSRPIKGKYSAVDDGDDYSQHEHSRVSSPVVLSARGEVSVEANGGSTRDDHQEPASNQVRDCGLTRTNDKKFAQISVPRARRIAPPDTPLRTVSGRKAALRHPTPDLQTLQGAYMANVQHLEKTAERLSMTSSIEDAIRDLHNEQKKADSRRSSLLPNSIDMPPLARNISNSGSIVEVNGAARSGGFSPGGFNMVSPREASSTATHDQSSSKGSRFGARPEPELEGRPLDSFAQFSFSGDSPRLSLDQSPADRELEDEESPKPTMRRQQFDPPTQLRISNPDEVDEQPKDVADVASINTFEAERVFSDFDGEHIIATPYATSESGRSAAGSQLGVENRRVSSGNQLSNARPSTFADPITGQQMVYYPAPVPMMLNLPKKISRLSQSEAARAKRRSQVLNSIPAATRKSAICLPDVLEDEGDSLLAEDDPAQDQQYLAQHQRATMGGRRTNSDIQHLPPQLRASVFFDAPGPSQLVEVKDASAVKTLDSILDASAFAPVSAFTDHLIAGHLGAEVYGNKRASKPMNVAFQAADIPKRKSLADMLLPKPRKTYSSEVLGIEKRRFTMSTSRGGRDKAEKSDDDDDDDDVLRLADGEMVNNEEEEEEDDEEQEQMYTGAPTTLLAELQLRKQRQKERTRPVASTYPNGMHSTLLELDAVAQVEKKSRNLKHVKLAWEDTRAGDDDFGNEDDEDVPLAMLFPNKTRTNQDQNRPMGLMERREMEDNEPLSRRRDRLQGKPLSRPMPRASTMMGNMGYAESGDDEGETLAQRVQRIKAAGGTATGLPSARPVSGDFASEMMFQLGGDPGKDTDKGKDKETTSPAEEEETLGQRRKRLIAEREAREKEVATGATSPQEDRPDLKKRHSLANILSSHPAAGAGSRTSSYGRPVAGLLAMHEQQSAQRSSTMLGLQNPQINPRHNAVAGGYTVPRTQSFGDKNQHQATLMNAGYGQQVLPQQQYQQNGVLPYAGYGYAPTPGYPMQTGYQQSIYQNPLAAQMQQMQQTMAGMQAMGVAPLNPQQVDMVERWRQSVMPSHT